MDLGCGVCSQNTTGNPGGHWEGISPSGFQTQILIAGFQTQIRKPKYKCKNGTFLYKYFGHKSENKTNTRYTDVAGFAAGFAALVLCAKTRSNPPTYLTPRKYESIAAVKEILKRFAISPKDLKEKPWAEDVQDKSLIEVWWPPYEVITDDYGASDHLYAPGFD